MYISKKIVGFFILVIFFTYFLFLPVFGLESEITGTHESLFKGYVTNKNYAPIKLKVFEIDKSFFYLTERNLEDNSFVPFVNLKITTENVSDYLLNVNENNIFIPESTKFVGYINQIEPPKSFNRVGFYRVVFEKAICPDGQIINLKSTITSKSEKSAYSPVHHLAKTTLGLLGGSLAGTLFSYQLGGLGLVAATHGYSLLAGAAAGGFIGTIGGFATKGKEAEIEPGDELTLIPVSEVSFNELKQISCKKSELPQTLETSNKANLKVEILSMKQKKDLLGESLFKIDIRFTNTSDEHYRLSNFFLRDSQGKEYSASTIDFNQDIFIDFPPKQTKTAQLDFFVDHPKTSHWLVLKSKDFNEERGIWKVKG